MAGELVITVVGNITADPEVKQVGGVTLATFTIAQTARVYKDGAFEDGKTTFVRCSAWREVGEHAGGSLTKGTRVIAQGRFEQRDYETQSGEKRSSYELQVDEIGPSLRYATATVHRVQTNRNQQTRREQYATQQAGSPSRERQYAPQQPAQGGWGAAAYDTETPF